jgi:hypothetical protein
LAIFLAFAAWEASALAESTSASPQTRDALSLAMEVVQISYPARLARQESVRTSEIAFRRTFGSNPQNVAVEKRFPGITDAMAVAASTEMEKALLAIEPTVLETVAKEMASRLSTDDIKATLAFYKSPAGVALLALDPRLMDRQTGMVPIGSLSIEHRQAIGRYQPSEVGQRTARAIQQSLALVPEIAARLYAPYRAQVSAKVEAAANAFIAGRVKK